MMKLIIVESPTKAMALQGFLGHGYRILASMGHVRDLPRKKLGVDVENGFRPIYWYRRGAKKVVKRLKKAASQASAIYLATDPDREGEAIAWHILQAMKVRGKPIHRIAFHEITPQAVKAAISTPGRLNMSLVNAQQARRILDRLVGYQVSPVLWKAIKGCRGLSAGRVQTVALRLVVERDREIERFEPDEYWTLEIELSKVNDALHFRARLVQVGPTDEDKADLKTEAEAKAVVEALAGAEYRVLQVRKRRKSRSPYPPYTTSTLQQDAAHRLHWSAGKTMRVAQQLYEGRRLPDEESPRSGKLKPMGLITYMRTDSTHVAESAQSEAREVISRYWSAEFLPQRPPQYKTRSKSAQEAHEAIRPTSSQRTPRAMREHLTPDQAKLYELIWRRFIASQMKPAVYHETTVDVACSQDDQDLPYIFRASGRELLFAGFMKAYQVKQTRRSSHKLGAAGQELPPLVDGEQLTLHDLFPEQNFTKPPSHFTESSLIKELERQGIGRPSTYAGIVRTILERKYVERKRKRSLEATGLGFLVCDFLVEQFPDLFAVEFTAEMEDDLDRIARGGQRWVEVLREFYTPFAATVEQAQKTAQANPVTAPRGKSQGKPTDEKCPECGGEVMIRQGKYGRFRACGNFPKCKWSAPLVVGECPQCGADLVERKGKRGIFWGCSNYPDCRFTCKPSQKAAS